MDYLKQSEKFKELLKKFRCAEAKNSARTGRVAKKPKSKVGLGRIPVAAVKQHDLSTNRILKPSPTKLPTYVLPASKRQSAFVPVRSPRDHQQSVLPRVESGRRPAFDLNEKAVTKHRMDHGESSLKQNNSSSRDSGFERSNPPNTSYCSFAQGVLNLPQSRKIEPPIFLRPKTPPVIDCSALVLKEQNAFVATVRNFSLQSMLATSEILFHLNNLEHLIARKISKSIRLNHISSTRCGIIASNDCVSEAGSKNSFVMDWLLSNDV